MMLCHRPQPTEYQEMEIREYQGVRLDPAIGPRDNSISGIQKVDINTYQLQITGLVQKPIIYTYDQVLEKEKAQRLITLYFVEGWDATVLWEGVPIADLSSCHCRVLVQHGLFYHLQYSNDAPVN